MNDSNNMTQHSMTPTLQLPNFNDTISLSSRDQAGGGAASSLLSTTADTQTREDPAGPPRVIEESEELKVKSEELRSGIGEAESGKREAEVPEQHCITPSLHHSVAAPPRRIVELPDRNAPATASEIALAMKMSERGARKAGGLGKYGNTLVAGQHIYALSSLPDAVRRAVERDRREQERAAVRMVAQPVGEAKVFDVPLSHFTDEEQKEALQRSAFVLEVDRVQQERPELTKSDIVDRIVRREVNLERAGKMDALVYPLLLTNGKRANIRLSLRNYHAWSATWDKYRRNKQDRANWWCLCDRYRGHVKARFGDERFWRKFSALYVSKAQRDLHNSYIEAKRFSAEAGVSELNMPSEWQVRRWYANHVDPMELLAGRMGEKFVYDKISTYTLRDWSKVEPDQCWTGDHHTFNVFAKWWDKYAGPINPATNTPQGAWRWCRPTLTHWMDAKSWRMVGHMFTRVPSRDTIEVALRRAIEACGGVPEICYFDCGKDYRAFGGQGRGFPGSQRMGYDSGRAQNICSTLGIRPVEALPYNPRAKLNERFFAAHESFARRWPSYCGRNDAHMKRLWRVKSGADQLTLAERIETYPDGHPFAKCLVRPEALPTIEHLEEQYLKWHAEVWNTRRSKGVINFGMSPDERYLHTTTRRRKVTQEEINLAFLRVYGVFKVGKGGMMHWCPPNGQKPDWKWYRSTKLQSYIGARLQMRVDARTQPAPSLYVFEPVEATVGGREITTWKQVVCEGPMGSVPNVFEVEAFNGTPEQYREEGRHRAAWRRKIREGEDAKERLVVARQMEQSVGIDRTERVPGKQADGTYQVEKVPRRFIPQTESKREQQERQAAVANARKGLLQDPEAAELANVYRYGGDEK